MRRSAFLLPACALATIAAAGCGGGDGGGGPTLDEFGSRNASTICEALIGCYGADIVELFVGPDCQRTFLSLWDQAQRPRLEEAIARGSVTYDASRADACLAAVAAAGCGAIDRPSLPDCEAALAGTIAPGGACSIDEECMGDSYCRTDAACPGTCQARVASGSACTSDAACQAGLRCAGGTCQAPARAGAACEGPTMIQCAGGLLCLGASAGGAGMPARAGACRAIDAVRSAALGDLCDPQSSEGPLCMAGLSCALTGVSGGTMPVFECESEASSGGPCHLGVPDPCPTGEFCDGVMPFMGDFDGTCTALPGSGEPCQGGRCAEGLRCNAASTCTPVSDVGGACSEGADCYSGSCEGGTCVEGMLCM